MKGHTKDPPKKYKRPWMEEISKPSKFTYSNKTTIAPSVFTDDILILDHMAKMEPVPEKTKPGKPTTEDIPHLRQAWKEKYKDIVEGIPEQPPLQREANHEIHPIDKTEQYKYHMPRCPKFLQQQLHEKIGHYVRIEW